MAQALEKVNVSPSLGKTFFSATKLVTLFRNSVSSEIRFSQKSLTRRKKGPLTLPRQVLVHQTPIFMLLLRVPAERSA